MLREMGHVNMADKGYVDHEREERLVKQGYCMKVHRKGGKNKPISEATAAAQKPDR